MRLPDFADPWIAAFFAFFGAVIMLGAIMGGKPERYGVLTLLAMFAVQIVLYSTVGRPNWDGVDLVSTTADFVGFVGFTIIALNADRRWPLVAAAMQLISLMAHYSQGFEVMVGGAYADFKAMPTLTAILTLLFGVLFHRHRLYVHGEDRDWMPFSQFANYRQMAQDAEQF